ncbi:hemicentin-1-like [Battus philenor]|uniref:hemicentin-1-like n=1 Tax=Battus philenor TaxID=42288 RepID=UPI0035D11899
MLTKYLPIWLIIYLAAMVNAKKSFTLVIDTTVSMREEVDLLKIYIDSVVNNLLDIDKYILVPFNDPGRSIPIVLNSPRKLIEVINMIEVSGNNNCPEMSMPAIEQALSSSMPESHIFVFTDGNPKNYSTLDSIQNLCRKQNNQVIIFLSGECFPSGRKSVMGTTDTYFDVAQMCSGSVFQLELSNFRQAFKIMNELIKTVWTDIQVQKIYYIGSKQIPFTADKHTTELVIAVSGDYSTFEITDTVSRIPGIEEIVNTRKTKVFRIIGPHIGYYTLNILCQGRTIVTIYKERRLVFLYGFSPKIPRSLKETSTQPMPDSNSYVFIALEEISMIIDSIHVKVDGGDEKEIHFEIVDRSRGLYLAQDYFAAEKPFTITINCRDKNNQVIKGTTTTLYPQSYVQAPLVQKPKILMIEPATALVNYKADFTIVCKVSGHPKPTITWYDTEGTTIQSEDALLETKSIYISYAYIQEVTKNSTIICKCESEIGENSLSMDLFVNRTFTFDVKQYPEDATFEYRTEGKLFCEVDSYPEASINWYHNDSLVENSESLEIVPEENMILIKEMTTDETGEYRCEISNLLETRTYTAIVDISGIEPPEVELENSEIVVKLDEPVKIECIIKKGKPMPTLHWKFKTNNGFEDIPEGVDTQDNYLEILSVKTKHKGVYICEVVNDFGTDAKEVSIEVQYVPIIKYIDNIITVKKQDYVKLSCEVDANPTARVTWTMTQGDVEVALDQRHKIDEYNTLSFTAFANDSGNYHCIAENPLGKDESTATVIVLEPPYINPPPTRTKFVKPGNTINLLCHVSYGYPIPNTTWQFIALNSSLTTMNRGGRTNNLIISNISKKDEGSYICLAENDVGSDTIEIVVKVL